jgi:hypothetical protein
VVQAVKTSMVITSKASSLIPVFFIFFRGSFRVSLGLVVFIDHFVVTGSMQNFLCLLSQQIWQEPVTSINPFFFCLSPVVREL